VNLIAHLAKLAGVGKSSGALDPFAEFVAGEATGERASASP
jgi:hypothetical protein